MRKWSAWSVCASAHLNHLSNFTNVQFKECGITAVWKALNSRYFESLYTTEELARKVPHSWNPIAPLAALYFQEVFLGGVLPLFIKIVDLRICTQIKENPQMRSMLSKMPPTLTQPIHFKYTLHVVPFFQLVPSRCAKMSLTVHSWPLSLQLAVWL